MAEGVICQPLNLKAGIQSQTSLHGILGGQMGTGTGFYSSTFVFHCHSYSTNAPCSLIYVSPTLLSNTVHMCAWAYLCTCTNTHTHTHTYVCVLRKLNVVRNCTVCLSKNNFDIILKIL